MKQVTLRWRCGSASSVERATALAARRESVMTQVWWGSVPPPPPGQHGSVPAAPKAPPQAFFPLAAPGARTLGLLPARNLSSALPPTLQKKNREGGSYNPVLTCSWLSPKKREEFGGEIRASTSTVSPRACTSGLKGQQASVQYLLPRPCHFLAQAPSSNLFPHTWGCFASRAGGR